MEQMGLLGEKFCEINFGFIGKLSFLLPLLNEIGDHNHGQFTCNNAFFGSPGTHPAQQMHFLDHIFLVNGRKHLGQIVRTDVQIIHHQHLKIYTEYNSYHVFDVLKEPDQV